MQNRAYGIGLILFVVACVVAYVIGLDEAVIKVVGNGAQVISGLLAAFFLYRAAAGFSGEDSVRPYWIWLSIGYVLNAAGFLAFAWYEIVLGQEVPAPSIADLLWIAAYPALLYGSIALLRQYTSSGLAVQINKWSWGAAAVAVLLAGYFLMWPAVTSDVSLLEKVVLLAYPVLDVFLFAAAITIALMMRQFGAGQIGAPWTFIALGMITVTVADMVYTYLAAAELYETGNLVDLGWVLQGALVAWGGILQYRLVKGAGSTNRAA